MKRIFGLLLIFLLVGCPQEFYAFVENSSGNEIEFISNNSAKTRDVIKPGETKKVYIFPNCQLVKIGALIGYLDFSSAPDDAWVSLNGGGEIKFELLFRSSEFFIKSDGGELHKLTLAPNCKR